MKSFIQILQSWIWDTGMKDNLTEDQREVIKSAAVEYAEEVAKFNLKEASYIVDAPLSERDKIKNFEIIIPE